MELGISNDAAELVTLLPTPVKPVDDGRWESLEVKHKADNINIDSAASSSIFTSKNRLIIPKGQKKDQEGKDDLDKTPYQASVDELPCSLPIKNKEVLVQIFIILADNHTPWLNRMQMSAVFRAFNDKGSQEHPLVEMPEAEWIGLCRVYDQTYGIPIQVLAGLYGTHLVKTNTAEKALEFLRKEASFNEAQPSVITTL